MLLGLLWGPPDLHNTLDIVTAYKPDAEVQSHLGYMCKLKPRGGFDLLEVVKLLTDELRQEVKSSAAGPPLFLPQDLPP